MSDAASLRIVRGPLAWEVFRFGAPLAVGMVLQTAFNLIDAYLIAQLSPDQRDAAVGALGVCDQIAALGTIVSYGVSTATATLIATQKGAGDMAAVKHTAWQSLLIVSALSLLFALLGLLSPWIVTDLIGLKGAVADVASRYLRVIMAGSFSIYFLLQMTSIQRALGSAKTPVTMLALGNLLNVVFAVVCLFGAEPARQWDLPGAPVHPTLAWGAAVAQALRIPTLGMVGAAWATIAARGLVLVPMFVVLARRFDVFPTFKQMKPDGRELLRIATLAWPSSVQFVLRISAALLVNSLVARFFTSAHNQTATTAMGLVFRVDTLTLFVAMGWGSAAQTFVAQNLGAGEPERAVRAGWITAGYDILTNLILWAALANYGRDILRLFGRDQAAISIAADYLRIVAPSYVPLGIGIVLGNAMVGAGAARTTLRVDALVILLLQVPLCLASVHFLGTDISALFSCVALAAIGSALSYVVTYGRGRWRSPAASPALQTP
jgi:putative MATE family efflux protein